MTIRRFPFNETLKFDTGCKLFMWTIKYENHVKLNHAYLS